MSFWEKIKDKNIRNMSIAEGTSCRTCEHSQWYTTKALEGLKLSLYCHALGVLIDNKIYDCEAQVIPKEH